MAVSLYVRKGVSAAAAVCLYVCTAPALPFSLVQLTYCRRKRMLSDQILLCSDRAGLRSSIITKKQVKHVCYWDRSCFAGIVHQMALAYRSEVELISGLSQIVSCVRARALSRCPASFMVGSFRALYSLFEVLLVNQLLNLQIHRRHCNINITCGRLV
jgi:hypothetical protein